MEKVIHRSESRGFTDQGWLKSYHTFSYGSYYDPRRIHFGGLRVLNDDIIEGGEGFSSHPHDNMEIIFIPLKGGIEHGDHMGNITIVSEGELGVITAGTGIIHNEYNHSPHEPVEVIKLWIFPAEYELKPRYSTIKMDVGKRNTLNPVIVPKDDPAVGEHVTWISQDAWLYMASLDEGVSLTHAVHASNHGVYVFVLEGSVTIDGSKLRPRDGLGLWDAEAVTIHSDSDSRLLILEVPMKKA